MKRLCWMSTDQMNVTKKAGDCVYLSRRIGDCVWMRGYCLDVTS